jgi:hypothetical protein
MSTEFLHNRKILIATIAVLTLGGVTWGVVAIAKNRKTAVPKEFTVDAMKAKSQDPGKVFEQIHQAMNRTDLTEEQKHAIRENAREVMEAQMDKRMDQYFTATSDSQKQVILDEQIDEMQAHMKDWEQRRAQWQKDHPGETRGPGGGPGGPGGPPGGPPGGGSAGSTTGQSGGPNAGPGDRHGPGQHQPGAERQHQKMRTESRDPDRSARRMAYFTAMRQRAQQRGIQMPGFMGGDRGGPR